MNRFSFFRISLICIIWIFLGLGCKGLTSEQQAAIRPVTLEYWTVFDDVTLLREFAKEYTALRPYVNITIRQIRYEEFDTLFTNALADDVSPDLVSVHAHWMRKYQPRLAPMPAQVQVADVSIQGNYRKETVVTLQNFAMPTPRAIETNFVQTVADDVIIDGDVYGIPLSIDTLAVYYNKDILDRAGVATPPESWEQFLDAVKKTTTFGADGRIIQSGVPLGTGSNIDNAADIFATLLLQRNIAIINDGTVTLDANLRQLGMNHPSFEVLRFYTDFAQPTKDVYSWNAEKDTAFEAFTRGQSAFYIGYAFDATRIRERAPQMNVEIIPLPQLNQNQPINIANYWIQSVVKKSPHQDIAWDFIRFITSQNNIKRYTEAVQQPSPVRAHIAEQIDSPLLSPFATQVLTAQNWYRGKNAAVATEAIKTMIDSYLVPVPEGEDAIKRDTELLQRAAQTIQQTL